MLIDFFELTVAVIFFAIIYYGFVDFGFQPNHHWSKVKM
jgi:hypothetical protein